jgi:pullulanase/glycogen debranching enzyme
MTAIRSGVSGAAAERASTFPWWQRGLIYQIYPLSFQDTDGNGTGDLPGILMRLEYLSWLGIDAVWLSPVHPSPMDDFGYDITDYTDVHPLFGTLGDLDRLIADLHARRIRLLLDFVPNHTSSVHPDGPVRNATGMSGAIPPPAAALPTTGSAGSATAPGNSMPGAVSTIIMPF